MVQTQFRYFLPLGERQRAFDNAVALVYRAFPKQSDGANKNQLYQHWNQCNRCLQHVLSLKDNFKEDRQLRKNFKTSAFCELLKDCQRYLYEINALKDLQDMCEVNLLAVETLDDKEQANDITAWTLSLQASMYESTGKAQKAIELNMKGYEMRLGEVPLKGGLLGGFEQNLAYNYNTANDHETALRWFEKSRDTWIAWNIKEGREADWPTVTKKNMASKHLRDSLEITKFHANVMPVEHARGLLKLSEALLQDSYNSSGEVTDLRDEVEVHLLRRDLQAVEFTKEADFDLWVPIFWR
ncbi:hypothetical protein N0V84_009926 [Fusarium piperis]|uniref:Uncharacterized protein n=1 Tax=Fusarium piperis TaxID=1435070 RepID=A0A9W9BJK4_9HYPO|nr:hypothetical protein N0V84_009926 [Fusarium piperis]